MFSIISRTTALSLQQSLSISNIVLKNAFEDYRAITTSELSERTFIKFCVDRFRCSEPFLPIHWVPSTFFVESIPAGVIEDEFYPLFIQAFAGKCIGADYDQEFQRFCQNHWNLDCRNESTKWSTFMNRGWQPTSQVKQSIVQCLGVETAEILIAEFKIYWKDSGQSSVDWEGKLLDWFNNFRQAEL